MTVVVEPNRVRDVGDRPRGLNQDATRGTHPHTEQVFPWRCAEKMAEASVELAVRQAGRLCQFAGSERFGEALVHRANSRGYAPE